MSTTVDDLIAVKDAAVAACERVTAAWGSGDLAAAARDCQAVVELAGVYDAAESCDDAVSMDDYEAMLASPAGSLPPFPRGADY